jgi:hypothetical protein
MFALKKLGMSFFRGDKIPRTLSWLKISEARMLELFPPFLLFRLKFLELDDNWNHVRVKLPLHAFTQNAAGVMFGGAQAAVADPIAALACLKQLRNLKSLEQDAMHQFLLSSSSSPSPSLSVAQVSCFLVSCFCCSYSTLTHINYCFQTLTTSTEPTRTAPSPSTSSSFTSTSSTSSSFSSSHPRSGSAVDVWTRSMTIDFKLSATTDLELRFSFGGTERLKQILHDLKVYYYLSSLSFLPSFPSSRFPSAFPFFCCILASLLLIRYVICSQVHGRSDPVFEYAFYDTNGNLCSVIHNTVAIRPRGYSKHRTLQSRNHPLPHTPHSYPSSSSSHSSPRSHSP